MSASALRHCDGIVRGFHLDPDPVVPVRTLSVAISDQSELTAIQPCYNRSPLRNMANQMQKIVQKQVRMTSLLSISTCPKSARRPGAENEGIR